MEDDDPARATTTVTFNTNNPQSPVSSGDSRQGNFQIPGPANNALALFPAGFQVIPLYVLANVTIFGFALLGLLRAREPASLAVSAASAGSRTITELIGCEAL